jgi:hypothetical protein
VDASREPSWLLVSWQTKGTATDCRIKISAVNPRAAPREASVPPVASGATAPSAGQPKTPTQWQHLLRMLPFPSHGLFLRQVRHHVSTPVLHHPVDDVDQAAHHAHQSLLLGFAFLDLPLVVVVEHGVTGLSRHFRHLHLLDGQKVEDAVQFPIALFVLLVLALASRTEPHRRDACEPRQLVGVAEALDVADVGDERRRRHICQYPVLQITKVKMRKMY